MLRLTHIGCLALFLTLLTAGAALAHKVNIFAYVEGGTVYTESYFPDGTKVAEGKVLIFDSQNQLLLEGRTDRQGLFSFDIPKVEELTIVIEAGMGHKNSYRLKKSDLEAGR